MAQDKAEAIAIFRASQQPLLWLRAMSGISCIENKLQSTPTNAPAETSALLLTLGDKKLTLHADVLKKSTPLASPPTACRFMWTGTGGGRRRLMWMPKS